MLDNFCLRLNTTTSSLAVDDTLIFGHLPSKAEMSSTLVCGNYVRHAYYVFSFQPRNSSSVSERSSWGLRLAFSPPGSF